MNGKTYENEILYHYTDFQALDGILHDARLRVNNVLNMNDAAEMRYFMNRLCDAVAGRLEDEGDLRKAAQVKELFKEALKREFYHPAYAACFSLHRDDAAQWERYGNRGRGVCVAFQGKYLQKMAQGALSLQTVFYQEDMSTHNLTGVFYRLVKRNEELSAESPDIQKALNYAWSCSAAFKHPSFLSEKEVRLVVSPAVSGPVTISAGSVSRSTIPWNWIPCAGKSESAGRNWCRKLLSGRNPRSRSRFCRII